MIVLQWMLSGTSTSRCVHVDELLWYVDDLFIQDRIGCFCARLLQGLQRVISDTEVCYLSTDI